MTKEKLFKLLSGLFPTAYYDFSGYEKMPKPPYIAYMERPPDNFGADNKVYYSSENYKVELYIKRVDTQSENKLESLFDKEKIYWEKEKVWIEELNLFQVVYEI